MKRPSLPRILLTLFLLVPPMAWTADPLPAKKLIEFGWDEPDTAFLRQHIAEMEKMPFDGCVFHIEHKLASGEKIKFLSECWGTRALSTAQLQPALDDLKATPFRRFNHNFLRFNVTPGNVDWFDDFSPILNNARHAGRIASEGKCKGILLDIETYFAPIFEYHKQRDAEKKSWEVYSQQVRLRGREIMNAFQEKFPGITIFLTFGYSLPWAQTENGKKTLADVEYGLLAPFLDGMVEAAKSGTRLVDGCELAYSFDYLPLFDRDYKTMKEGLLPIVTDKKKYAEIFSAGFGLWMDFNSQKNPWNTNDFSKNHFQPHLFEACVRKALERADEYVWIYTQTPRWWSTNGPAHLPEAYLTAVQKARKGVKSQ